MSARPPIRAPWLRSWSAFRNHSWNNAKLWTYLLFFHGTRVPLYFVKTILGVPGGALRMGYAWFSEVWDLEGRESVQILKSKAKGKSTPGSITAGQAQRYKNKILGLKVTAGVLLLIGAGAGFIYVRVGVWPLQAAGVGLVGLLGYVGQPQDKPLFTDPDPESLPKLSKSIIAEALQATDIKKLVKALEEDDGVKRLKVWTEWTRTGRGQVITVDLPPGVTAPEVVKHRMRFIGALGRPEAACFLEYDAQVSPGRLKVTVFRNVGTVDDISLWEMPDSVDGFGQFRIGENLQGDAQTIGLLWQSLLVGALARMGKSFFLRLLLTSFALDTRFQLMIYELKGTGDMKPLSKVAMSYFQGESAEDLDGAMNGLRWLLGEMRRRKPVIAELAETNPGLCPENKITPAIAADPELGMPMIVCCVDEFQILAENAVYAEEFEQISADVIRQGQTVGIIMIQATHRPDADTGSTKLRSLFQMRAAFRTGESAVDKMILGPAVNNAPLRPSSFSSSDVGKMVMADGENVRVIQVDHMSSEACRLAVDTAYRMRSDAGVLVGHAAGVMDMSGSEPDSDTVRVIDHLLSVWPDGAEWVSTNDMAGKMSAEWADLYPDMSGRQLTTKLGVFGVKSHSHRLGGGNPIACYRWDEVVKAASE